MHPRNHLALLSTVSLVVAMALGSKPLSAAASNDSALASVQFRSYEAARAESARTRRPILLVFSNPHCGPCKALEHAAFENPIGLRLVNTAYVPVRFTLKIGDRDHVRETKEARSAANRLNIVGVPQVRVVSPDERVIGHFSWTTQSDVFWNLRRLSAALP